MFQTLSVNSSSEITHTQDFFMILWANPYLSGMVIMVSGVLIGGLVVLAVINFANKD